MRIKRCKRTKQIERLIYDVNDYLKKNKIKDESNDCFQVVMWSLLQQHLYQGFNYYRDMEIAGEKFSTLAGTSDPEKFDYLQLY